MAIIPGAWDKILNFPLIAEFLLHPGILPSLPSPLSPSFSLSILPDWATSSGLGYLFILSANCNFLGYTIQLECDFLTNLLRIYIFLKQIQATFWKKLQQHWSLSSVLCHLSTVFHCACLIVPFFFCPPFHLTSVWLCYASHDVCPSLRQRRGEW